MGCAVSAPKVKESKSPQHNKVQPTSVAATATASAPPPPPPPPPPAVDSSAAHQRRPEAAPAVPPPPPTAAPSQGTTTSARQQPSTQTDAAPKEQQPTLTKAPSSKLKPSSQAAAPAEEPEEKKKEKASTDIVPRPVSKSLEGEQIAAGWPSWLASVASEAIRGWVPRRADSFEKLDKIGQGTYSNVYKARDLETGKLVALKKVRFDNLEPESVRFMAREIEVLRRLDHPNIVKLEGLVTSRMSCSLYLVFEYMEHDLAGLAASPGITFTEAQVKCYMHQLLSGLEHCHTNGVLHRDIKGSNLLLDNNGTLKIADFGLATFYRPEQNVPLTSRVVTLWYRPPELLLGATHYGVAVDLWSAGCILAELLAGKPIMPGRTEVEQLHKIFKLCGSPSEEYWRKSKLPHATIFKPSQPYKRNLKEIFKEFPATSLALLDILLAIEPADRGSATAALAHDFFHTEPLPCDPSSLPEYPPSKEYDAKLRDEEARRNKAAGSRAGRGGLNDKEKRNSTSLLQQPPQHKQSKAVPAPHANAELQESIAIQKQQMGKQISGPVAKSSSERFLGDAAQGQTLGGAGLPSLSGIASAQFKTLDTPEGPMAGGKDRHLHRTGTNTRLGSTQAAGAVPGSVGGNWAAQAGVTGGASAGKILPAGDALGDRTVSMARNSKLGQSGGVAVPKEVSTALQAGDVSFTMQKKAGAVSCDLGVPRNRMHSVDDKDMDISFQGKGRGTPPSSSSGATGTNGTRKSGPLGDRAKVDPKTWMLTQAGGENNPGIAAALAQARDGSGAAAPGAESGASKLTGMSHGSGRNGVVDMSPGGKGLSGEEMPRPRSGGPGRGRESSPGKERVADGSPRSVRDAKGSWDASPAGKGPAEASPAKGGVPRKRSPAAATGLVVGPN